MKSWDAVIIGAGVIGMSLGIELRRAGLSVVILDKNQPGREASWAAGGMLVDTEVDEHPALCQLASQSAAMYPEFVHVLQDESGIAVDLRSQGTIRFIDEGDKNLRVTGNPLSYDEFHTLEPALEYPAPAVFLAERCVDPRQLMDALIATAKHLSIDIASGAEVREVVVEDGHAIAALTPKTRYMGSVIVNCAGAWASHVAPLKIPTVPVKGQMLAVTPCPVKHVIRGRGVYLIPRNHGRLVIGSTVEDAGYDKRVQPQTIQSLHQSAAVLAPVIGEARILEDWAGLRPGTPDKLPIMGATSLEGYFVSTGHYRDGILLAPVSAKLMTQLITTGKPDVDLTPFALSRFES